MHNRYQNQHLLINETEQEQIKNYPVVIVGCGTGSIIAECILRLGFETLTLIDNELVKSCDLSSEPFYEQDINLNKADVLKQRLLQINSNAKIHVYNQLFQKSDLRKIISTQKVIVNALGFNRDAISLFDRICHTFKMPVLHFFNLGWGGLAALVVPNGLSLSQVIKFDNQLNEIKMLEYFSGYQEFWGQESTWLKQIITNYTNEKGNMPLSKTSIDNWLLASMGAHVLFNLTTQKEVKIFPDFYLSSVLND